MNPVLQSGYGYEYDAWLASACMPASAVRKLLDRYGTSEACHQAVCRNDVELKELISHRFYQVLYSTGAKENLEKYRPDIVVHGDDWVNGFQKPVRDEVVSILASYGGTLIEYQCQHDGRIIPICGACSGCYGLFS